MSKLLKNLVPLPHRKSVDLLIEDMYISCIKFDSWLVVYLVVQDLSKLSASAATFAIGKEAKHSSGENKERNRHLTSDRTWDYLASL